MHHRSFAAPLATSQVRPRAWLGGFAAATVVKRDVVVRMRDGVRLATDVPLPRLQGADEQPVSYLRVVPGWVEDRVKKAVGEANR